MHSPYWKRDTRLPICCATTCASVMVPSALQVHLTDIHECRRSKCQQLCSTTGLSGSISLTSHDCSHRQGELKWTRSPLAMLLSISTFAPSQWGPGMLNCLPGQFALLCPLDLKPASFLRCPEGTFRAPLLPGTFLLIDMWQV